VVEKPRLNSGFMPDGKAPIPCRDRRNDSHAGWV
jgi:hypothetical protein